MKVLPVLPPVTQPWAAIIVRRHAPKPPEKPEQVGGFRLYRPCLRWEFGFSCAFCLVHERDIKFSGVEGWGLTEVEHFVTKSSAPSQRNIYRNCFLICGRCNRVRGKHAHVDSQGRKLLNPCESRWTDHFVVTGSQLQPQDDEAAHTLKVYRLNEAGKVAMREARKEKILEARRFLVDTADFRPRLLGLAREGESNGARYAKALTRMRWQAAKDLVRLLAIPKDHDESCRCGHDSHNSIPEVLEEQTFDLIDLLPSGKRTKS